MIIQEIHIEEMVLNESFQVVAVIERASGLKRFQELPQAQAKGNEHGGFGC